MSEQQPRQVGSAMWGGRSPNRRPAAVPSPEPAMDQRDILALVVLAVGLVLAPVGAGIQWGPGAAVLAAALALIAAGLILGAGDR